MRGRRPGSDRGRFCFCVFFGAGWDLLVCPLNFSRYTSVLSVCHFYAGVLLRDSDCDESKSSKRRSAFAASFLGSLGLTLPNFSRAEALGAALKALPHIEDVTMFTRVSSGSADKMREGSRRCDAL